MSGASVLADEWDVSEDRERRAGAAWAARSREWIGARIARDWLMEELGCPDYTAEASLCRVAGSAVPVSIGQLVADTWGTGEAAANDGVWGKIVVPWEADEKAKLACSSLFKGRDALGSKVDFKEDWIAGLFTFEDRRWGDESCFSAHGVRFHRSSLVDYFDLQPPNSAPEVQPVLETPRGPVGGRPASKHGDALAIAVLRLAALSGPELSRYTVDALAAELESDYLAIGERPPNERSRETYAGGILRVLRARET